MHDHAIKVRVDGNMLVRFNRVGWDNSEDVGYDVV